MEAMGEGFGYGDAEYWDARYLDDGASSFDWYQRYSALRPFVRSSVPLRARVLVVGCGNAVMSEDMVKDGYEDIMNIDISPVAIEMMKIKYAHIPQLKYMQMDVRNMSYFPDEYFDSVIDKGTLDSLMCGFNARISASQMLEEVSRILRPGGVYILITYGDPFVRIPHLNHSGLSWEIALYILPRPGFHKGASSSKPVTEPVPLTGSGLLPPGFVLEDPDSHYIYVCKKMEGLVGLTPNFSKSAPTTTLH